MLSLVLKRCMPHRCAHYFSLHISQALQDRPGRTLPLLVASCCVSRKVTNKCREHLATCGFHMLSTPRAPARPKHRLRQLILHLTKIGRTKQGKSVCRELECASGCGLTVVASLCSMLQELNSSSVTLLCPSQAPVDQSLGDANAGLATVPSEDAGALVDADASPCQEDNAACCTAEVFEASPRAVATDTVLQFLPSSIDYTGELRKPSPHCTCDSCEHSHVLDAFLQDQGTSMTPVLAERAVADATVPLRTSPSTHSAAVQATMDFAGEIPDGLPKDLLPALF